MISAIVHSNSPRTKSFLGRSFYKSLYTCIEHILTASEADSMRILSAIPDHKKVKVMGEIRCDSVIEDFGPGIPATTVVPPLRVIL